MFCALNVATIYPQCEINGKKSKVNRENLVTGHLSSNSPEILLNCNDVQINKFSNQNQIKSNHPPVKSNQITVAIQKVQIKSNHCQLIKKSNQIDSNHYRLPKFQIKSNHFWFPKIQIKSNQFISLI